MNIKTLITVQERQLQNIKNFAKYKKEVYSFLKSHDAIFIRTTIRNTNFCCIEFDFKDRPNKNKFKRELKAFLLTLEIAPFEIYADEAWSEISLCIEN